MTDYLWRSSHWLFPSNLIKWLYLPDFAERPNTDFLLCKYNLERVSLMRKCNLFVDQYNSGLCLAGNIDNDKPKVLPELLDEMDGNRKLIYKLQLNTLYKLQLGKMWTKWAILSSSVLSICRIGSKVHFISERLLY